MNTKSLKQKQNLKMKERRKKQTGLTSKCISFLKIFHRPSLKIQCQHRRHFKTHFCCLLHCFKLLLLKSKQKNVTSRLQFLFYKMKGFIWHKGSNYAIQTHHDRVLGITVKQAEKRQKISKVGMNLIQFFSNILLCVLGILRLRKLTHYYLLLGTIILH